MINAEFIKQLVSSAGSVGSNYIEANDSLGRKDKQMKIKISKKEAKESSYWLSHISTNNDDNLEQIKLSLIEDANQLILIFAAILRKLED
ncbi:MAG: four helix bundle protein [Chitinophagaceae bacterium]|nr:four helix bundle protein [Chitinophagaceae bacterium]